MTSSPRRIIAAVQTMYEERYGKSDEKFEHFDLTLKNNEVEPHRSTVPVFAFDHPGNRRSYVVQGKVGKTDATSILNSASSAEHVVTVVADEYTRQALQVFKENKKITCFKTEEMQNQDRYRHEYNVRLESHSAFDGNPSCQMQDSDPFAKYHGLEAGKNYLVSEFLPDVGWTPEVVRVISSNDDN